MSRDDKAPLFTRRDFVRRSLAIGAAGTLGVGAYSVFIEPHELSVEHIDLLLSRLPKTFDGFKLAQISDLHYGPNSEPQITVGDRQMSALVERVIRLGPDLVVITGDFVTLPWITPHNQAAHLAQHKAAARNAEPCAQILAELARKISTIAILGNHDSLSGADMVVSALTSHNVDVLRNRAVPLERASRRLWLVGLEDALEGHPDMDVALRNVPKAEPVILLVHEPDFADVAARYPVDLQLSGHSHGGQIRLPFVGPLHLPEMGRKYPSGLRQIRSMFLYTNRGIGTLMVPVRFNCTPEITLLTLHAA
jgi:predicted MPP superfamily phosphohydrolase